MEHGIRYFTNPHLGLYCLVLRIAHHKVISNVEGLLGCVFPLLSKVATVPQLRSKVKVTRS